MVMKRASLCLMAVAMVVLLAITAVLIDVGYIFFKRNLQNIADAATLAGARELIDGNDVKVKLNYVLANGLIAMRLKISILMIVMLR